MGNHQLFAGVGMIEHVDGVSVHPGQPFGGQNVPRRTGCDQLTRVQDRDAVGVGRREAEIVQYDDDGTARGGE